ncbi:MAG: hypothetical protein JO225_16370 [Candidatus Eremiobacteraeota bacterium]|nr:hypothetical protein [Candidatus Eremiobacteraeota bacterium]
MDSSAARPIARALATIAIVGALGAAPTIPAPERSTPNEILARVTERDAQVESYSAPVHIDARFHKLFTFHFHFNGTQYYKRPGKMAFDVRAIPSQYRKLFVELGTPMTWPALYNLRVVDAPVASTAGYRLEGVPKHACEVRSMLVDVDDEQTAPLHVFWTTKDGATIDMHITQQVVAGFQLPAHAEADIAESGFKVHATIDYGPYVLNETVADSVFTGS